MKLSKSRASEMLSKFNGRRVLVIGDFILDHFVWGGVERISPEAPVPVVDVREESYRLGGALNVAANLAALGARPTAVGMIGDDIFADQIRRQSELSGIVLKAVTTPDRPTIRKSRVMAGGQQMVRIDREVIGKPDAVTSQQILKNIAEALKSADGIIFSDYAKGVIHRAVVKSTVGSAAKARIPIVADPKLQNFWSYEGVTLLTPNTKEAGESLGIRLRTQSEIESAGKQILKKLRLRALLITRGEQGMSLFESSGRSTHIPTRAKEVYDVTGAGDTVTAVTGLALASGIDLRSSLELANLAAGVVVGKIGTSVATPSEIISAL